MLDNLAVVLFRPKFAENVGSAARACANMGVSRLILAAPRDHDPGRAEALATARGRQVLAAAVRCPDLETALAPFSRVYGTTARIGGWRKGMVTPRAAAAEIVPALAAGEATALVFGPEDAGLTNQETRLCGRLVTIPTADGATSLNLAQAVLILLYECLTTARDHARPGGPPAVVTPPCAANVGREITHAEREALFSTLGKALAAIDFLKDDNPDYFLLPMRRFAERVRPTRAEFNMLMGVCRQILWATGRTGTGLRPPRGVLESDETR
ncbi:MAG: TrmH family RNA methyltransferase [Desulfovibrionaceae bacterium]|nr:TrmH family RNA methyltransferase [Desulfovibrionaceae bacterium]